MSSKSPEEVVGAKTEPDAESSKKPVIELWHPFARPMPPPFDPSDPKSIQSWSPY